MTFVGKVLVAVQLVLSVCFMAFAGAVYTAQVNWRAKSLGLQEQVAKVQQELDDQTQELTKTNAEKDKQIGDLKSEVALSDDKLKDATDARQRLTRELEAARTAVDQQTVVANLAEEQATFRKEESDRQRARNGLLHSQVNDLLAENRTLQDQLFSKDLAIDSIQAKQKQIVEELAKVRRQLAGTVVAGTSGGPDYVGAEDAPPPNVTGQVLATQKSPKSQSEFVEISLGSDDGFRRGNELFVYRGDTYLGKIRLETVTPDRSVGVVLPASRARNGQIQKGDNVTSKL